jgi:hypothetical protein
MIKTVARQLDTAPTSRSPIRHPHRITAAVVATCGPQLLPGAARRVGLRESAACREQERRINADSVR